MQSVPAMAARVSLKGASIAMSSIISIPPEFAENAWIDEQGYKKLYEESISNPEAFWAEQGKRIHWFKPYTKVKDTSFGPDDVSIRWFYDGETNAAYNCIDRHLPEKKNDVAIIWEGDDPSEDRHITYGELHEQVCRLGNSLKANGVKKGDRVTIYLPMIPEAIFSMLACARIGAIHSVVFGGFSPDSLAGRIQDCHSTFLITADEGLRGGRKVPLKKNADKALLSCTEVTTVLDVRRTGREVAPAGGRDPRNHDERPHDPRHCPEH